jgi:hypothetical protein
MAAPTSTVFTEPNHVIWVEGTNVDAGNNDYTVQYNQVNLSKGFSIITGTLTNMTVTVRGFNKDGQAADITNDLFAVGALSSDTTYAWWAPLPYKGITIRAARSNATNEVNLQAFFPKK